MVASWLKDALAQVDRINILRLLYVGLCTPPMPERLLKLRLASVETKNSLTIVTALVGRAAILLLAAAAAQAQHTVPLFPAASEYDAIGWEGFVRIANHSDEAGDVRIDAIDDTGRRFGPLTLSLDRRATRHFNSRDLENGNTKKGLEGSTGRGEGDWRLVLSSELDIEVLSYVRTHDGFVTKIGDVIPYGGASRVDNRTTLDSDYWISIFNPARNSNQVSLLRLVNMADVEAEVSVFGVDDDGTWAGPVSFSIPSEAARTVTASELETGSGDLTGRFGSGTGKWQLYIRSPQPLRVMNLLRSPTGHLTNLSSASAPRQVGSVHSVPFVPSLNDPFHREGFIRIINHSEQPGEVHIEAIDDTGVRFEPLVLSLSGGQTAHFRTRDLETGNPNKGLVGSTGAGDGSWRLEMSSELDIDVLAYVRTPDGFVTAMHDVAPVASDTHQLAFFNPADNREQKSVLRLINPGEMDADVAVRGVDDRGESSSEVRLVVPAGTSLWVTAEELEAGTPEMDGAMGDGTGKWRLAVVSEQRLQVMSLLSSPSGHLTNLSGSTVRYDDEFPDSAVEFVYNDNVVVVRMSEELVDAVDDDYYAHEFYREFSDEFDFVIFLMNFDCPCESGFPWGGIYVSASNDVEGIGKDVYSASGRLHFTKNLKGTIFVASNRLRAGLASHEILHAWGVSLKLPHRSGEAFGGGHWGFSSANGALGGYDRADLEDHGDGRYSAGWFGTGGNGGLPWSPIELYLAGLIPPHEVPDLQVAIGAEWLVEDGQPVRTEAGHPVFTADELALFTIDELIAVNGPRNPDHASSQRDFRAAVVLLTDVAHPAHEWQLARLSAEVDSFSYQGNVDRDPRHNQGVPVFNFFEETGGRGSISTGVLDALRATRAND